MALGTALALQLGTTAAGALANRVLSPRPEIPDISAEAQAEFNERRRDLDSILDRRRQNVQADLAASGRTGSAGASARQQVFGEFARSQANLAGDQAEAVSDAEQREQLAEFRQQSQRAANRAQAISDLVRGVGGTLAMNQLQTEDDGEGGGGGGGGRTGGGERAIEFGREAGLFPEQQSLSGVLGGGQSGGGGGGTSGGQRFNALDFVNRDLEARYGISPEDIGID